MQANKKIKSCKFEANSSHQPEMLIKQKKSLSDTAVFINYPQFPYEQKKNTIFGKSFRNFRKQSKPNNNYKNLFKRMCTFALSFNTEL